MPALEHTWGADPDLAGVWGAYELHKCRRCGLFRVRWRKVGYESWKIYCDYEGGPERKEAGACVTQGQLFPFPK